MVDVEQEVTEVRRRLAKVNAAPAPPPVVKEVVVQQPAPQLDNSRELANLNQALARSTHMNELTKKECFRLIMDRSNESRLVVEVWGLQGQKTIFLGEQWLPSLDAIRGFSRKTRQERVTFTAGLQERLGFGREDEEKSSGGGIAQGLRVLNSFIFPRVEAFDRSSESDNWRSYGVAP